MYELTLAGRLDEARAKQYQLIKLFDAMLLGVDFPEGVRAAAKLRGIKLGVGRQPLSSEAVAQTEKVSRQLAALLAELGYR